MFHRGFSTLVFCLLISLPSFVFAQATSASVPADTPLSELKPGQFIWMPEVVPEGPLVMVISITEQRAYLYRNGLLIAVSTVSTGKKGKETPTGVFTILQKNKDHKSSLYNDAPMPFMQRLTWDGVALHAGKLPGYPASHGCIRLPAAFASDLFEITGPTTTAVIVTDEPLADGETALALAQRSDAVVPIAPALLQRERPALAAATPAPRLPAARTIPAPPIAAAGQQTIQLAAALSPAEAAAQWETLAGQRPELKAMRMAVVPAVVNGKQYYRLRASAPDAHATCKALKRAGIACFPVS